MREFDVTFVARDGREDRRTVSAMSEIDAATQAIAAGGAPLHVELRGHAWFARLNRPVRLSGRVSALDIALFAEQLGEMLKANVTIEQALDLLARESNRLTVARMSSRLLQKVRAGWAFSQALSEERSIPGFFPGLVRGAERGGQLEDGLGYLAAYLLRRADARGKIVAALTYPIIVVTTAVFAFFFVMFVVIPEFAPLFSGVERKLPAVTRLVLYLSALLTTRSSVIMFVIFTLPATIWLFARNVPAAGQWLGQRLRRLPVVRLGLLLDVAKTLRVVGALLSSRIDASEALTLAREAATSTRLKLSLLQAARHVREGGALSDALRGIDIVPESVSTLVVLGERTGEVGAALTRASNLLELETNRRVDRLVSLINPIAVVLLGAMIAILISGVMLGILSANQFALR